MIVVTVELWPGGDAERKKTLGTAHIINDGTGTVQRGNYDVRLFTWHTPPKVWKRGRVVGFDRLGRGPFDLLYLALRGIVGSRVPPLTRVESESSNATHA